MINNLANYLTGAPGDFWGFLGIGLAFLCTGITELLTEKTINWQKAWWLLPAVIFVILSIRCSEYGTVKIVDAGKVLGYLGIGSGFLCTASTIHADRQKEKPKWFISVGMMVLGLIFTLGAAVIMMPSGLVTINGLIDVVIFVLVLSGLYKIWLIIYRQSK